MHNTRSQGKADATVESEADKSKLTALQTREYELERMERAIREKEQRLKAHENSMRKELDLIETARKQLESDRDNFDRQANKRELEFEAREQQINKTQQSNLQDEAAALPQFESRKEIHFKPEYNNLMLPGVRQTDTTPTIKVSFREITETVPYYDGYNIPFIAFHSRLPSSEGNRAA
ncbi:hypothetical protein ALC62_09096 [Cyphomyrmex costatus]|uniref:Uncharacterized protein n=1 Tax=Cyphomyrmex costatus TaxID=456900 RepID=A0A151IFX6_9HYME|nr:hypothetical protein ALC62_09096 [Cyphomyrmex costatus]